MEDDGMFYGHLVHFRGLLLYFMDIWNSSWLFVGIHTYFFRFGMFYQDKSGNPGCIRAHVSGYNAEPQITFHSNDYSNYCKCQIRPTPPDSPRGYVLPTGVR
jgi:hypothetical protein